MPLVSFSIFVDNSNFDSLIDEITSSELNLISLNQFNGQHKEIKINKKIEIHSFPKNENYQMDMVNEIYSFCLSYPQSIIILISELNFQNTEKILKKKNFQIFQIKKNEESILKEFQEKYLKKKDPMIIETKSDWDDGNLSSNQFNF
jgi:hypothetical protein